MSEETKIQVFQYEGADVSFQIGDGVMINATEMYKRFGRKKNPHLWLKNKSTQEFIQEYSKLRNTNLPDLVQVIHGGSDGEHGTWMHEDIALEFARWLSPKFAIWCNDRIKELSKYGFTATNEKLDELVNNPDLLISLATQLKTERAERERLESENERKQLLIEEKEVVINEQRKEMENVAPKVKYFNDVLNSPDLITTSVIAKSLGMSAETLNKKLSKAGIQYKQSGTWLLKAPYYGWNLGKTVTTPFLHSDGRPGSRDSWKWNQRGKMFIVALCNNDFEIRPSIEEVKTRMANLN